MIHYHKLKQKISMYSIHIVEQEYNILKRKPWDYGAKIFIPKELAIHRLEMTKMLKDLVKFTNKFKVSNMFWLIT